MIPNSSPAKWELTDRQRLRMEHSPAMDALRFAAAALWHCGSRFQMLTVGPAFRFSLSFFGSTGNFPG